MPTELQDNLTQKLLESLEKTEDGFGIFDARDRLIYANQNFAGLFCLDKDSAISLTFEQLVNHAWEQNTGIFIETDNITQWLESARNKRRSSDFRVFEVDLVDGRWMRMTEQLLSDGALFSYCTDITDSKNYQVELQAYSEQLYTLATTDSLTKISNRGHFYETAKNALKRCVREGREMSCVLIDIDHFKQINDQFGHQAGDYLLKTFAANLKTHLRDYDIIARIGGEEFALILQDMPFDSAVALARRLREKIEKDSFCFHGQTFSITASLGLTPLSASDQSIDDLVRIADRNMYKAKQQGRNRVCY